MKQLLLLAMLTGALVLSVRAQLQIAPPYDANYTFADLGAVPEVPTRYGGLAFLPGDPNTLIIGGEANVVQGAIYSVRVTRGADKHITGFAGPAQFFTAGAYNDGGVVYWPDNVLFLARWPVNEMGQTRWGSATTDKIVNLGPLQVVGSPGGLTFVPAGYPGAGQLKAASWAGGQFYTFALAPDGTGLFNVSGATLETTMPGGPEGFVYVPPGSPQFTDYGWMLVSEYSAGQITAYQIDSNGNPVIDSRTVFLSGLTGAEGAALDPLTGDFLFSTFGGFNHVVIVRGLAPPPSADLSITKAAAAVVTVGSSLTYTLTVTNAGPNPATNVVLVDILPSAVTYQSASPSQGGCIVNAGEVSCALGTLTIGGQATVSLVVRLDQIGQITNVARVNSALVDPVSANNTATTVTMVEGSDAATLLINMYAGLTITGTVGRTYRIDYTTDVQTNGPWTALTNLALPQSPYLWFDAGSAVVPRRFYRAVLQP